MEKLSAECRLYDWLTNLNSSYLLSQSEAKEESTVISTIAFSRPQPRLRVSVSLRSDWLSELSTSVMIGLKMSNSIRSQSEIKEESIVIFFARNQIASMCQIAINYPY